MKYTPHLLVSAVISSMLFFTASSWGAESSLRQTLFSTTDSAFKEANKIQADILAPYNYEEALSAYKKAEKRLDKGQGVDKIKKDLAESRAYLKLAVESTLLAEVTLSDSLQARADAVSSQAVDYAPDAWRDAEKSFSLAAKSIEAGDVNKARRLSEKAQKQFRDAELQAIKANYLDETRTLLEQAQRNKIYKVAPTILASAEKNLNEAEHLLSTNRYDTDEARYKAQLAKTQVLHASKVADTVNKLKDKDITPEELILQYEYYIQTIGNTLDINTQFHKGNETPVQEIITTINALEKDSFALGQAQTEIHSLQDEVTRLEQQLGVQSQKLATQEAARQRFQTLDSSFTPSEAIVIMQAGNPIIRLIGLNFNVGSSQINTEYFGLLRKVQTALAAYPGRKLVVEGHTDSFGGDETNQALSSERAASVREYLLANMPNLPPSQVEAVGFGEAKPIASNETQQGRTKNRRIDIKIIEL
ncbi:OmpA family protein [Teredinibacter waterburyi]|uniref:OmpA family protein n=1 Tax=Teredinibacter waterburyi TaxID=1500538 RepID=UPI00165F41D8|nr:OmpA family protein [Teredinibacter waterburyi]